jgi:hypothetical protein
MMFNEKNHQYCSPTLILSDLMHNCITFFVEKVTLNLRRATYKTKLSKAGYPDVRRPSSGRFGHNSEPDFFIYLVKPESDLSPTYLVNFSSRQKPEP